MSCERALSPALCRAFLAAQRLHCPGSDRTTGLARPLSQGPGPRPLAAEASEALLRQRKEDMAARLLARHFACISPHQVPPPPHFHLAPLPPFLPHPTPPATPNPVLVSAPPFSKVLQPSPRPPTSPTNPHPPAGLVLTGSALTGMDSEFDVDVCNEFQAREPDLPEDLNPKQLSTGMARRTWIDA
jgi:hypothetical protein